MCTFGVVFVFLCLSLDICVVIGEFFLFGLMCHFKYHVVILFLCMDNNRYRC